MASLFTREQYDLLLQHTQTVKKKAAGACCVLCARARFLCLLLQLLKPQQQQHSVMSMRCLPLLQMQPLSMQLRPLPIPLMPLSMTGARAHVFILELLFFQLCVVRVWAFLF